MTDGYSGNSAGANNVAGNGGQNSVQNGAQNARKFIREPAKRVFAAELRETRLQFKDGNDEKSPVYVILPTGERCNRIFFCGQMTQKEKKGDDTPFYTARVTDPTGIFFINAGSYQQEAMAKISKIEQGMYVSVIGKPVVRTTPDGSVFVSVRVENISVTDIDTAKIWIDDAAKATLDRIAVFGKTDDSIKAEEFYNTNLDVYKQAAYNALIKTEM